MSAIAGARAGGRGAPRRRSQERPSRRAAAMARFERDSSAGFARVGAPGTRHLPARELAGPRGPGEARRGSPESVGRAWTVVDGCGSGHGSPDGEAARQGGPMEFAREGRRDSSTRHVPAAPRGSTRARPGPDARDPRFQADAARARDMIERSAGSAPDGRSAASEAQHPVERTRMKRLVPCLAATPAANRAAPNRNSRPRSRRDGCEAAKPCATSCFRVHADVDRRNLLDPGASALVLQPMTSSCGQWKW